MNDRGPPGRHPVTSAPGSGEARAPTTGSRTRPTQLPSPGRPATNARAWAAGRLALCVILFLCWLGYMAYLVFTLPKTPSGRPLVLSHPQFLVSEIDIVGQVSDPEGARVTVQEVLYPAEGAPLKVGDEIRVTNLADCRPLRITDAGPEPPPDLAGPGSYLMPLRRAGTRYEVVVVPTSPGFPPESLSAFPRIYPASPEALAEYARIPKPAGH